MVERNKKSGGGTPVLVCSLGASPEADSAKSIPLSPPPPPPHIHTRFPGQGREVWMVLHQAFPTGGKIFFAQRTLGHHTCHLPSLVLTPWPGLSLSPAPL